MIKKSPITNLPAGQSLALAGRQSLITNRGFTLIELLVVISILGVLAALLLSNMAGVRERARDAKRKSDLKEIQKALEMYKQDQSAPSYPATGSLETALETGGYMKEVPGDPLGIGTAIPYYYSRGATDFLSYTLRACLENVSDPQGETDTTNCTSTKKIELHAP